MTNSYMLDTAGLLAPQIPHSLKLLKSLYLNGIACDHSSAGVGKTFCASWIAKQFNAPVIVVCPKNVKPTWKRVLKQFGITAKLIISYEKLVSGGTPYLKYKEPTINSFTGKPQQEWRYQLIDVKFPAGHLIILDEAHKCKASASLSAGLLMDLKRKGYKTLLLSATQATKATEMRGFGYATNLHNLYNWRSWCLDNGAEEVNTRYGDIMVDVEEKQSQEKLKRCHHNLFNIQKISSRLTREDMGDIFTDDHVNPEAFDLGSNSVKIQSVYDNLQAEIAKLEERTENYSGHVFALIVAARMKIELLKMPFFIESIDEIIRENNSAVIFVNFNSSIEFLRDNLHHKCSVVVGGQSEKHRELEIENFQSNKNRVSLNNIKSGGNSISYHDLLGGYPRQSLISPTWSAIDLIQSIGRINRANGKTPTYQRIVYADGTIENRICERLRIKIKNLNCLNDGDLDELSFL